MIRSTTALLVALAALAPPSGAVASGGEPPPKASAPAVEDGSAGEYPPPPGSAADVALWRSARAATEAIVVERARAGTLQARVRSNRYLERLEEAAARAGPGGGDAFTRLRQRLLGAWQWDYQVVARPWPVDPTRGCGYQALTFESALRAPAGADQGILAAARGQLRECVDKAQGAVRPLAEANRALEAAWLEADRALGPPAKSPAVQGVKEDEQEERLEPGSGGEHEKEKRPEPGSGGEHEKEVR